MKRWIIAIILLLAATIGLYVVSRPPEFTARELGNFAFDQQHGTAADVPERFRKLDGKRVVIVGEMFCPESPSDAFLRFYLLAQVPEARPPLVQELIKCQSPIPVKFGEFVRAVGVLHIDIVHADDEDSGHLYRLDVEKLTDVSPNDTPFRLHWILILAAAAMSPLLWQFIRLRRRARRSTLGLCPVCGYDLRATPYRCPECGTVISTTPVG